jgi:hypothetical protein
MNIEFKMNDENISSYIIENGRLKEQVKALEKKIKLYEISTRNDKEKIDDLIYKIKVLNALC